MRNTKTMDDWLVETKSSLMRALKISEEGSVPLHNIYVLAPIIYCDINNTNNESLMEEMFAESEEQVPRD